LTATHWSILCGNPIAIPILTKLTNNFTTNLDKVNWTNLSHNQNATHIIKQHLSNCCWELLCDNKNAVSIIEKHMNDICSICHEPLASKSKSINGYCSHFNWSGLCCNPNAVKLLKQRFSVIQDPREIVWSSLSANVNGIPILEMLTNNFTTNLEKIDWGQFCYNISSVPILLRYYERLQHRIIWRYLCGNPNAILLLQHATNNFTKNLEILDWYSLSGNPNAVFLIEKILLGEIPESQNLKNEIDWDVLCYNPNAIQLIKNNPNHIYWDMLFQNTSIVETDKNRYQYWIDYITHFVYNL
jgi:hypothetical protein